MGVLSPCKVTLLAAGLVSSGPMTPGPSFSVILLMTHGHMVAAVVPGICRVCHEDNLSGGAFGIREEISQQGHGDISLARVASYVQV